MEVLLPSAHYPIVAIKPRYGESADHSELLELVFVSGQDDSKVEALI